MSLWPHRSIYMRTTQETVGHLKIGVEVNKNKKNSEQDSAWKYIFIRIREEKERKVIWATRRDARGARQFLYDSMMYK